MKSLILVKQKEPVADCGMGTHMDHMSSYVKIPPRLFCLSRSSTHRQKTSGNFCINLISVMEIVR